jgi:hypothetical protein
MRNLRLLDIYRLDCTATHGSSGDERSGAFRIESPIDGGVLHVIASNGGGWDHVSVSRVNRCPNWPEMSYVKELFFGDVTVMQLHVPADDHIDCHPHCLHLWRPHDQEIPRPPAWMVGPKLKAKESA